MRTVILVRGKWWCWHRWRGIYGHTTRFYVDECMKCGRQRKTLLYV